MTNSIIKNSLFAAAAVAVTISGFSAASAQNHTVKSVTVDYADLDLTSADGKATLKGRIKGAVRQVCGGYDPRNLKDAMDHSQCVDQAHMSASRASVTVLAAAAAGKPATETALRIGN